MLQSEISERVIAGEKLWCILIDPDKLPFKEVTDFILMTNQSSCDFILVGDSLGNVFQGNETTLSVELDNMIYHGQIVGKALKNAHLCVDMPFMSYQASEDTALLNMGNVIKKTGAQSVKIEMNFSLLNLVGLASQSGIPIVAHVGLCPQSYNTYGGYKKKGKNK